eukprot:evm.model.scf_1246.3 EVM.evm.TU.scf_1246.3   scf_1246:16162-16761(+)
MSAPAQHSRLASRPAGGVQTALGLCGRSCRPVASPRSGRTAVCGGLGKRHLCASGAPPGNGRRRELKGDVGHELGKDGILGGAFAALVLAGAFTLLQHVEPTLAASVEERQPEVHAHVGKLYDLAEGEDFWENMARYGRFFLSVMVGSVYVMVKPLGELLKRPGTAVLLILALVLGYFFVTNTIQAMLGLSEFQYNAPY